MKKILISFALAFITIFNSANAAKPHKNDCPYSPYETKKAKRQNKRQQKAYSRQYKNKKNKQAKRYNGNYHNNAEYSQNKMTHNRVVRKTGQGISHGYYVTTHNVVTRILHINDGNEKYSNQDDI